MVLPKNACIVLRQFILDAQALQSKATLWWRTSYILPDISFVPMDLLLDEEEDLVTRPTQVLVGAFY